MFDVHAVPSGWGIYPKVLGLSSYGLFVFLGIVLGAVYYFASARREQVGGERAAFIVLGALTGAALGAKLASLLLHVPFYLSNPEAFATGRTVLGGFLGGFLGILIVKKLCGIKGRYGNLIAPAAALGLAIGRVGCLLGGCCYGKPASWGIDFGDGILRLPTQVFELLFHLAAFFILHLMLRGMKERISDPGILFRGYVCAYLLFRFFTEPLREGVALWAGFTVYQLICLVALGIFVLRHSISKTYKKKKEAVFRGGRK